MAGKNIGSQGDRFSVPVRPELHHFNGIAQVEMENLITLESVQARASCCSKQVVNRCRDRTRAAMLWQFQGRKRMFGPIRFDKKAAFVWQRLHAEIINELLCGRHA